MTWTVGGGGSTTRPSWHYTHVPALAGQLGQVGNGGGRGHVCHNTLAVTAAGREVLGLANQALHRRRDVPRGETPTEKREHPGRESLLWPGACAATDTPAPPGCGWIDVADRGADTFEFLQDLHGHGRRYVIRSGRDRRLAGEDHVARPTASTGRCSRTRATCRRWGSRRSRCRAGRRAGASPGVTRARRVTRARGAGAGRRRAGQHPPAGLRARPRRRGALGPVGGARAGGRPAARRPPGPSRWSGSS